ncbi:MAG TPA: PglZ domain-containing protein, partial [Herpetosiphonaceae bacterium]|nr:PglZ domain-containing protein [Herpetosiphonaceae bacterium]
DAGQGFVLLLRAQPSELGWLWAHALLAERVYARPLREQLLHWDWRPHSIAVSDDEAAALARQHVAQDPAQWGAGGLEPDAAMLLDVLAGGADPEPDDRVILDLSIDAAGLPELEEANLPRWRARSLARLLVTEAWQHAPKLVGEGHELLIPAGRREWALQVLGQWLDSLRLRRGLSGAITEADRIATLGAMLGDATIKHGPFLSQTAERAVFANTCTRLAQKSGRELLQALAGMREDLGKHARGFWGSEREHARDVVPWAELLRLARATQTVLDVATESNWKTPQEAIGWYVGGGWRLDQAGEELLRDLQHPAPELLALMSPLRAAYRARWERHLIAWSELWEAAGCPLPPFGTAGEWLMDVLRDRRPTAILVVDALRYDLGATLAERVNEQEGAERATVRPARASLPSITALGMGLALPIPERELVAEIFDDKWQLTQTGNDLNLSVAADRREWWRTRGDVPAEGVLGAHKACLSFRRDGQRGCATPAADGA